MLSLPFSPNHLQYYNTFVECHCWSLQKSLHFWNYKYRLGLSHRWFPDMLIIITLYNCCLNLCINMYYNLFCVPIILLTLISSWLSQHSFLLSAWYSWSLALKRVPHPTAFYHAILLGWCSSNLDTNVVYFFPTGASILLSLKILQYLSRILLLIYIHSLGYLMDSPVYNFISIP